ncbi:DUF4214 domain-containing protein [Marinobacter sp.]|uniref:DUF4214 domain-containing protein n=1 Tax=Marinobacter sp. TaxID=50741 RepID=UPI003A91F239
MAVVSDYSALVSKWTWNAGWGGTVHGTPVFLTYSFGDAPLQLDFPTDNSAYFRSLIEAEKILFRQAIQAWGDISGVMFFEAAPGLGDLEAGVYDLESGVAGQGGLPAPGFYWENGSPHLFGVADSTQGGKIYLDYNGATWRIMLHEIGHALGLKHPHEDEPLLADHLDDSNHTVMSYNYIASTGLGALDIEAVQALYGGPSLDASHVSSWSWDAAVNRLTQVGSEAPEIIVGTAAHDVIDGRGGNDLIVTRAGNDVISVSGTQFQVNAGEGLDTLRVDFASTSVALVLHDGGHHYLHLNGSATVDMKAFAVERIAFKDATVAFDTGGVAGQAYRLYQAAFAREPDTPGLSYWVGVMDQGMTLHGVAARFLDSTEFKVTYGMQTTDQALVSLLYLNILGRDGEPAGQSYWTEYLGSGAFDRAGVLVGFSESEENTTNIAPMIDQGIWLV